MTKEVRVKPLFSSAIIMLISVAYACKLLKNIIFKKKSKKYTRNHERRPSYQTREKINKKKKNNNMRHNQR